MKKILWLIAAMLLLATPSTAQARTAAPVTATPIVPITHIVIIAFENKNYSDVIGNANAPYITSLANTYGKATGYLDDITGQSLPNYMALTGGSTAGITNDCLPSATCGSDGPSIFSQSTHFRAWEESMVTNCQATNAAPYAVRHNPAVYYRTLSTCSTDDIPLPANPGGLATPITFVTPNICDDMHGNSTCSTNLVSAGDTWLSNYLPKIMALGAYTNNSTAIFIWWDEGAGSTGQDIPFVVVSPDTAGVTYTPTIDHYNTLATIDDILGKSCLGSGCSATSFATAFNLK